MYKILILILISFFSWSQDFYYCNKKLEKMPVLQDGRIKPLKVHAQEILSLLTDKKKYKGYSATQTYCLLSSTFLALKHQIVLKTKIEHTKTQSLLSLSEISLDKLVEKKEIIRMSYFKEKNENGYKKELNKLLYKIELYSDITKGRNWMLPMVKDNQILWKPLALFIDNQINILQTKEVENKIERARKNYIRLQNDDFMIEYQYDRLKLLEISMILTFLALTFLVLFRKPNIAFSLATLLVIIEAIYLGLRIYISKRAPVTNMFETVIFSGLTSLLLSLILGYIKKEKIYLYMGLSYNFCTLMMANFATGMLSASISPLVPVLRDNIWLSTHVTTIIFSYGALALSWILANTLLIKRRFSTLSLSDQNYYNHVIYTTLKWGTTMLAAGIILGGVWADYSWGRFWGWDPKETWSLIVLCIYISILHGKYTRWISSDRFPTLVAASFMSVMMAWFGVNYILASGLHSYGFSEGGAIFLSSFFLIQILIIIITLNKKKIIT